MKRKIKSFGKKSLIATKKVVGRSRKVRKFAKLVLNTLDVGNRETSFYDVFKHYPKIPEYMRQIELSAALKHQPLISLVVPTYNTNIEYLKECIDSVLTQSYKNWELCIADDASPNKAVIRTIQEYITKDKRIKLHIRKKNGHISAATNSAVELASGEFIALLDHDDILWPNALYEVAEVINRNPDVDFIYTDEDKVDETGTVHSYPFLKPDFSPEFLESCNYITHFSVIRKNVVEKVGGLRVGYEGAQDWDLFLRITEITHNVIHIPKILYSWRIHDASTAKDTDAKPYVYAAQRKLLADHIARSGGRAEVRQGIIRQHCTVMYEPLSTPLVTIILYGGGNYRQAAKALASNTNYKNIEVKFASKAAGQVVTARDVQEYNKLLQEADGEYVVMFDATMSVTHSRWLDTLLGDIQRKGVGAVGGRTLSQDRSRIMRAGVGIGIYGVAAPLLEFMSSDDLHYIRGLYGQSRRNVAAVDSGCTIFHKDGLVKMGGFSADMADLFIVDACLELIDEGDRVIYNPFVETVDKNNITAGQRHDARAASVESNFKAKWGKYVSHDPYLNPSFTLANAQLGLN